MKTGIITIVLATLTSVAACKKDGAKTEGTATTPPANPTATATAPAPDSSRLEISVTEQGFEPDNAQVPAGKPVTLVFTRNTDNTCAKKVVVKMPDGNKLEKDLPLDQPVEIAATFPTAGTVGYACGMDMVKGTITVQ